MTVSATGTTTTDELDELIMSSSSISFLRVFRRALQAQTVEDESSDSDRLPPRVDPPLLTYSDANVNSDGTGDNDGDGSGGGSGGNNAIFVRIIISLMILVGAAVAVAGLSVLILKRLGMWNSFRFLCTHGWRRWRVRGEGDLVLESGLAGMTGRERRAVLERVLPATPYRKPENENAAASASTSSSKANDEADDNNNEPAVGQTAAAATTAAGNRGRAATESTILSGFSDDIVTGSNGTNDRPNVAAVLDSNAQEILQSDSGTKAEEEMSDGVAANPQHNSCSEQDQESECAICMSDYSEGDEVVTVPRCKHVFHKSCLMEWLENHDCCPYCRTPVATSAQMREAAIEVLGRRRANKLARRSLVMERGEEWEQQEMQEEDDADRIVERSAAAHEVELSSRQRQVPPPALQERNTEETSFVPEGEEEGVTAPSNDTAITEGRGAGNRREDNDDGYDPNPDDVLTLCETLGIDQPLARTALRSSAGDVQRAATMLLDELS